MKNKINVALISSEVMPFSKTGGLADFSFGLSKALSELGCRVSVFSPLYAKTKENHSDIDLVKRNLKVEFGNWNNNYNLGYKKVKGLDFYFIEKDSYFDRVFLYGSSEGDYFDNAQRFAFFSGAVISSLKSFGCKPDIIHCNDWQTALVPFYLRHTISKSEFLKTKIMFTIHNLAYQGIFLRDVMPDIGIGHDFFNPESLEFYEKLNFMKSGIIYSDLITTVSPTYANEILKDEFGCGLQGLLRSRNNYLYGILNGADYSHWDPGIDKFIRAPYSHKSIEKKIICKIDLLREFNMSLDQNKPLLGMVTRLTNQKGINIIVSAIEGIKKIGARLVILGSGNKEYEDIINNLASANPDIVSVKIGFDESIAHKIEAGSDIFLMPSNYEPCGLNQIYSLRYGTIPVVRAIGGLKDSIIDYTSDSQRGNGFAFDYASSDSFLQALERAVCLYKDQRAWSKLMKRNMKLDFSWCKTARSYLNLYQKLIKN